MGEQRGGWERKGKHSFCTTVKDCVGTPPFSVGMSHGTSRRTIRAHLALRGLSFPVCLATRRMLRAYAVEICDPVCPAGLHLGSLSRSSPSSRLIYGEGADGVGSVTAPLSGARASVRHGLWPGLSASVSSSAPVCQRRDESAQDQGQARSWCPLSHRKMWPRDSSEPGCCLYLLAGVIFFF